MSAYRYVSSRPCESIMPGPHRDAHQRYLAFGPVIGLKTPRRGLFAWLFGRS